jgi:hypothetical protein
MCNLILRGVFCLTLIFGSLALVNANTLSGYAVSHQRSNINAKIPGALVEFRDAVTNKPVSVKIKIGTAIKDRKDAFYAASTGDIGKWQADVKPGRYIVTITGGPGNKKESYTLNLNAMLPTCSTSTGYLDVTSCGATGSGGSSDDTQAIIDGVSAIASAGGGILHFPKGFFNVGTTTTTVALLPISLPSGITIEGVNGGITGSDWGNSRITLISPSSPSIVHDKTVFKIGENKRHISLRDITLLGYDYAAMNAGVAGSTGLLAEGNYPNSTFDVLFSNMTVWGFEIGIDVKACTADHVFGLGCAVDPEAKEIEWMVPWQFDQVKADHVSFFGLTAGVRMDSENTDWNFSSCWFHMPVDETNSHLIPVTSGIHIKRGGFIQVNNSFGGSDTPSSPGGNWIWAGSLGTLMITNSQCENVKNSLVWGRNPVDENENWDLGTTRSRIMVIGSELGAPVRLRYRVNYISEGNHYGPDTIQTDTELVRIWSTGDKFCDDGFAGDSCTPEIQGPGTVVFLSGAPAESTNIPEIPAQFGVKSVFSKGASVKDLLQLDPSTVYTDLTGTYSSAANGSLLYCSDCSFNTSTGACTSGGNGALAKRINGAWKCN